MALDISLGLFGSPLLWILTMPKLGIINQCVNWKQSFSALYLAENAIMACCKNKLVLDTAVDTEIILN